MGRVEDRRLRALERRAQYWAWDVATSKLEVEELSAAADWYGVALEADAAEGRRPDPTPEQAQAVEKLEVLYEQALREGGPPELRFPETLG
jgi:hypothetical protein